MAAQTQQKAKAKAAEPRAVRVLKTVNSGARLLDRAALRDFLMLSDETIDKLLDDADEAFPRPVPITSGKQHWTLRSVEAYVERKEKQAEREHRS